jgi:hypothetical protein
MRHPLRFQRTTAESKSDPALWLVQRGGSEDAPRFGLSPPSPDGVIVDKNSGVKLAQPWHYPATTPSCSNNWIVKFNNLESHDLYRRNPMIDGIGVEFLTARGQL